MAVMRAWLYTLKEKHILVVSPSGARDLLFPCVNGAFLPKISIAHREAALLK